jgi:hypothetical protein
MVMSYFSRKTSNKGWEVAVFILITVIGLVSIVSSGGGGGGDGSDHGKLQFSATNYDVTEGTATVTIAVTRTGGSDGAASVDYATSDGTADSTDYTATSGTLNWADGDAGAKTFTISITDDSTSESTETLNVTLSNAQTASLGTPSSATVTITDDDNPGTLQFSSSTYTVTEGTDPTVTITVTRTGGSTGAVAVDYATADGTATQPDDYTATNDTLNWTDGDTADKTFTVDITDDTTPELTESFSISLSGVVGATLGTPSSTTVTIKNDDSIAVNGTVSAPGGSLAFKAPGLLDRMFAVVFGKGAYAAVSDLVMPVASATVELYEVDANGDVVGSALDNATANGTGDFTLDAPADALDSVKYIVRASGTTETMDSRITGTTVNVDPSTDAVSRMVATVASDLADITPQEVMDMQTDMEELTSDIDKSGLTATNMSDRLFDKAQAGVGQYNVFRSKASGGQICGHVQTAGGTALEGIRIRVHDYLDQRTRARTYTDASGDYCLNVPVQGDSDPDGGTFNGEYIIGANNRTDDPDISASEWLGTGTTYTEYDASKITVANTTPVTGTDFSLEAGARISGTVTASDSAAGLEGIEIIVRDFDTRRGLGSARTDKDGNYSVSVIPGSYLIQVRNRTTEGYSSEIYASAFITNPAWIYGESVPANAGDTLDMDFVLEPGWQLSGNINDGAPVRYAKIDIDWSNGSTVDNIHTDRNGDYNVWLKKGETINVFAHGQRSKGLILNASQTLDFTASAGDLSTITGQLKDSSDNPVRNAGIRLYRLDDPTTTNLRAYAEIDENGNFTLLSDETGDHILELRIAQESDVGSSIYLNKLQQLSGDIINIASTGSDLPLSTITMPDGGVLRGHVYNESSTSGTLTPDVNLRVQVRDGGTALENRFIQTRVRGDGSYVLALPAGTYDRVKMRDATSGGNCNNITITAGMTTVVDYYDGDDVCDVTTP